MHNVTVRYCLKNVELKHFLAVPPILFPVNREKITVAGTMICKTVIGQNKKREDFFR